MIRHVGITIQYVFSGCVNVMADMFRTRGVFVFHSTAAVIPGTYEFQLIGGGSITTCTMTVGVGGVITSTSVVGPTIPGYGINQPGGDQFTTTRVSNYLSRYPEWTMPPGPGDCSSTLGQHWANQTLVDGVENGSYELPILKLYGNPPGGATIIRTPQTTIESYRRKSDWLGYGWMGTDEGPYTDTPPFADVDVEYHFYAPGPNGPEIPEEDKVQVPIDITNGGESTVQFCIDGTCVLIDPGGTVPFIWPTYEGDDPDITITYPDCPLCEPPDIPPPDWNPEDPGDPTNCVPSPGVPCPVFTIYIPPPRTNPDPNPEPEPEPGPTDGNEGNFQGCISAPCEIPFVYEFRSRP